MNMKIYNLKFVLYIFFLGRLRSMKWLNQDYHALITWLINIKSQIRNSGEELKLPKERTESLHELLTRMIMNTFVGCYDDFWIFCQSLHLFLHVACMVGASIIASAIFLLLPKPMNNESIHIWYCINEAIGLV